MAKERVEYEVVGRDVGGSKAFKDVGDAAERAGDKVDGLGKSAADTGDKVGKAGHDAEGAAKEYRGLASDIERAQGEMRRLAVEINKTGNMDLFKDLRRQRSELRRLLSVQDILKEVRPDDKSGVFAAIGTALADLGRIVPAVLNAGGGLGDAAKSVATTIGTGAKDVLGAVVNESKAAGAAIVGGVKDGVQSAGKWASSNPMLAAGVAAGITVGTPLIGAALAGAVGAGGIATGVLLASKDPRVGEAWGQLGESAMESLSGAASVFVDPLVHGAQVFWATLGKIMPGIRGDFVALAPVADKLFAGAGGFVERMMPGVDALAHASGPILTMLADELPKAGAALSYAFESIAAGSEGGKEALHDMLISVEGTVIAVGKIIGGLEKWYQAEHAVAESLKSVLITGNLDDAKRAWGELIYGADAYTRVAPAATSAFQAVSAALVPVGGEAQLTADQFKTLSGQIAATEQTADVLAGQMTDKLLGVTMTLDQATLGFAEAQTRLGQSIDDNGLKLDIHTQKGQANRESILAAVQANVAQYDAMIRAGAGADQAAQAYDTNTQALESQLRKAGFTQGAIDGLIGKYRHVPDNVNTTIATQGLTTAISRLDDLIRKLNHMPTRRDIYVTEHLSTTGGFSYKSPDRLYDYPGGGNSEGGLIRGPGTGTSDDIVRRVSNGEFVVRAAAVRTLGVGFLDRLNQADRNPGALAAATPASGGRVVATRPADLEGALERAVTRALSRATLTIDDRTGRLGNLLSRAG